MITVLFVDDEPALLDVSRIFLERGGALKVDTCLSARDALLMLKERSYDAIVSDYEMAGMNGIQFLKTLRNMGDTTPFIVFTGKGREHVVIEALNSGADFYLQKGGDPRAQFTELIHKIYQAVQKRRAEISLRITTKSVEILPDQIFWLDTRGRFIHANEAACRSLGYTLPELLSITLLDLDPDLDRETWNSFIDRIRALKSATLHTTCRRKDGPDLTALLTCTYAEFEGRGIIFAISKDTSQKEASQDTRASEWNWFHDVVNTMPALVFEVNGSGIILFCNQFTRACTGSAGNPGAQERTVYHYLHPQYHEKVRELIRRTLQDPATRSVKVMITGCAGPAVPLTLHAHPLFSRSGIIPDRVLLTGSSGDTRNGSSLLPAEELQYRAAFEHAHEGTLLIADIILDSNRKACEIIGLPKKKIVGRTLADLSPPYQPDGRESNIAWLEHFQGALSGSTVTFSWRFRRSDQPAGPVWISLKAHVSDQEKLVLAQLTDSPPAGK